jgi:hypothetical protein
MLQEVKIRLDDARVLLRDSGAKPPQATVMLTSLTKLGAICEEAPPVFEVPRQHVGPERWLDTVKRGYAGRFAAAFAAHGYDDVQDLTVSKNSWCREGGSNAACCVHVHM